MTPYEEFQERSDQINEVNRLLSLQLGERPGCQWAHRMNDSYLIVFHVFALEDFCGPYLSPKPEKEYGLASGLLKRLAKAICDQCGQSVLDEKLPQLQNVDEVFLIRHTLAHCFGQAQKIRQGQRLTPDVLRRYGFETDDDENNRDARWWPRRFDAYRACVGPVVCLAEWISGTMKSLRNA